MESTSIDPPNNPENPKSIVKHMASSERANEPPPQPRVRKVTTVTHTLAIVVGKSPEEVKVWVLTTCERKIIPVSKPHLFINLTVGTWMTVGIYPDGTLASFSPWSYRLQAYPTAVQNDVAYVERNAAEFRFQKAVSFKEIAEEMNDPYAADPRYFSDHVNVYKVSGFGLVLAHPSFDAWTNGKDGQVVWIQWCGDASNKYCWTVNSFINGKDDQQMSDKQLREFAEFIRNRKLKSNLPTPEEEVVARHFGLITDVNIEKKTVNCWSPHVSMEMDHIARIPQPPKNREVDCPMLPPLVGQWIQFDLKYKDLEKYATSPTGTRLNIPEYLPITSPAGVAVAQVNRVLRIMISCILVKGTDLPNLFELPHFGFIIDRKASLISGNHVQLVLEKTSPKVRKASGVCWIVEQSLVVQPQDVTIEKLQELPVLYVETRDAMEVSNIIAVERSTTTPSPPPPKISPTSTTSSNSTLSTGITTLKYQQPAQYHNYQASRPEYFSGTNVLMGTGQILNDRAANPFQQKRKPMMTYTGATTEGHAIVEKLNIGSNSGILWMFDTNSSIHFVHNDEFPFTTGDYAFVKLTQKLDANMNTGFRWLWIGGKKLDAPFEAYTSKHMLMIENDVEFHMFDKLERPMYRSKFFPSICDIGWRVSAKPAMGRIYRVTISRQKIQHQALLNTTAFQWVIVSVQSNHRSQYANQQRSQANRAMMDTVRTPPPSDRSSTSPPLPTALTTSTDE